jgi:hypothetical protein
MVIAAKVETLWALGLRCFPEMMRLFNVYAESIGGAQEHIVLEAIYQAMAEPELLFPPVAGVSKERRRYGIAGCPVVGLGQA